MDDAQPYTHPSIDLQAWQQASTDSTVLIADGHDIRITVRSGHLSISDGPPHQPRIRKIPRLPRTHARLLILAGHGMISMEAMRWLTWAGLPWSMLDVFESTTCATSGPRKDDARLIRAQCQAAGTGAGLAVIRALTSAKLTGHADNLRDLLPSPVAVSLLRQLAADVLAADSLGSIRATEGKAAAAYWQCWQRVAVPWSPADLVRVPAHWQGFNQRASLTRQYDKDQRGASPNRDASDPVNAMLSYAYKIGETECVHACHATGLHPAIGIQHTDRPGRNSMALDMLEAIRPACERIVLGYLAPDGSIPYDPDGRPRYTDRRYFTETREGVCRLIPPLTHALASCAADLASNILPHAMMTARVIAGEHKRADLISLSHDGRKVTGQARAHRSYPRARLRPGVPLSALITDDIWTQVSPLIPVAPSAKRRKGKQRGRTDRENLASIAARFILGVPWFQVEGNRQVITKYLGELEAAGTWDDIRAVIEQAGHLKDLAD